MPKKTRLDQLLTDRGLAESRSKAQALIMAGKVYSENAQLTKPGQQVNTELHVTVKAPAHPWVSRGGIKLAHALEHFSIDVTGVVALDVGASTGGFTDVLLTHGAAKVYAIDVGHGQLDWKLRTDERVVVMEKTNARHLDPATIPDPITFICSDVSFISLTKALPPALELAEPGAILVSLIKPQFEAGRDQVGKGGVVRDQAVHQQVCDDIQQWFASTHPQWQPLPGFDSPIIPSPITGPEGNVEFLIALIRGN